MSYIHPNLKQLSHSSDVTLHRCPRKYELYKLLPRVDQEGDVHLDYGSIVGLGIQEMLTHGSIEKATWKMFCTWKKLIDDEEGLRDKKTFWFALYSLDKFSMVLKTVFAKYKLAYINGRPATELGFVIHMGNGFSYRGFIDAVLIDTKLNKLVVLELKTTKFSNVNEAMYKHSGQALGYSLILDILNELLNFERTPTYDIVYGIYKSGKMEFETMPFIKSHTERALWIKQLMLDQDTIERYSADDYFPMYGETCYDFFRPCDYFGTCTLSNKHLVGPLDKVKEKVESEDKYDYHFDLAQLIESQLSQL